MIKIDWINDFFNLLQKIFFVYLINLNKKIVVLFSKVLFAGSEFGVSNFNWNIDWNPSYGKLTQMYKIVRIYI